MKKINLLSLITLFAFVFTLQSCGGGGGGDDPVTPTEDTTPPVIANLKPVENSTIVFNNPIIVTADVADNVALASYTIEISNTLTRGIITEIPFSAVVDGTLSGKDAKISESIELPLYSADGISKYKDGDYYVILTVFDKAGNKTESSNKIKFAYP